MMKYAVEETFFLLTTLDQSQRDTCQKKHISYLRKKTPKDKISCKNMFVYVIHKTTTTINKYIKILNY